MKKRLDLIMSEREICRSRTAAGILIARGSVKVNGNLIIKPSKTVDIESQIEIIEPLAFVSRGGEKLDHALSIWDISVQGAVAADVGSSTGGFTDCLLQRGASKVYAIDVGTGQLDKKLTSDPRVVSIEQTDVREAKLPELVDLACIDLSFISLTHVLVKVKKLLKETGIIVALVKPQFEVGPGQVDRRGVVSDKVKRDDALQKIKSIATNFGLKLMNETTSPITGSKGNVEYLLYLKNTKDCQI